ncbi:serine hydrolase [Streptomyces sp. NPDC002346]
MRRLPTSPTSRYVGRRPQACPRRGRPACRRSTAIATTGSPASVLHSRRTSGPATNWARPSPSWSTGNPWPTSGAAGPTRPVLSGPHGSYGPNPRAFGHDGAGGSCGLADPEAGVALGYVMNRMGPGIADDPRKMALIEAVYEAL